MGIDCFNGFNSDVDILITKNDEYSKNSKELKYLNFKNSENLPEALFNESEKKHFRKKNNSTYLKKKKIYKFTLEDLQDEINDILRIRIFFFENSIFKNFSSLIFLTGNGPYHEGLMFFTKNKKFYVAQSYPITFMKVFDFYKGISEIISFNSLNDNSKKYNISEIYCPKESIIISDILKIINNTQNKYNLLNNNCQNFCNNILKELRQNFKFGIDEKPSLTKINYYKNQNKFSGYKIP